MRSVEERGNVQAKTKEEAKPRLRNGLNLTQANAGTLGGAIYLDSTVRHSYTSSAPGLARELQ
jgi:hypothetical protein